MQKWLDFEEIFQKLKQRTTYVFFQNLPKKKTFSPKKVNTQSKRHESEIEVNIQTKHVLNVCPLKCKLGKRHKLRTRN